jgi:transposase-like protein
MEAIKYFSDKDTCFQFMCAVRWPSGKIYCPRCGSDAVKFIKTRYLFECKDCPSQKQFSVKVGTILEDSPIALNKWLTAVWLIVNCKNGISSVELAKDIGVTQKTGWFLLHRIRLALQTGTFERLSGDVEVDETFIGGKARNMHKHIRSRKITGTGGSGKVAVMGLLDRHGEVRTKIIGERNRKTMHREVRAHVEPGGNLYTDAHKGYHGLEAEYVHQVIDHAEKYVDGQIHTNGLENFWSLLKRGLTGTYISVEPFHLFRYLDEQVWRYNNREMNDGERFLRAVVLIVGKRLTYQELTGKLAAETAS